MISYYKDRILSSLRPTYWDAPDYFKSSRRRRSSAEIERQIAEERHRAMRNTGMW